MKAHAYVRKQHFYTESGYSWSIHSLYLSLMSRMRKCTVYMSLMRKISMREQEEEEPDSKEQPSSFRWHQICVLCCQKNSTLLNTALLLYEVLDWSLMSTLSAVDSRRDGNSSSSMSFHESVERLIKCLVYLIFVCLRGLSATLINSQPLTSLPSHCDC